MKTKEQKIPKWFKGMIYGEGDEVTNPFTGICYTLNALELSVYDFIIGSQLVLEVAPTSVTKISCNCCSSYRFHIPIRMNNVAHKTIDSTN
jgi:hypothetical protein